MKLAPGDRPVSTEAALPAPRMNRAAAVSRASEKAICATTSGLRGRNLQRRLTTSSPACSLRSATTALRESLSAGPSANPIVPTTQKAKVAARIAGLGPASQTMSSGDTLPNEAMRTLDDHRPRTHPHEAAT